MDGLNDDASTSEATSTTGSNETDLLSGGSIAGDGGGMTDVLMVTSSVRVLNGVHGNSTDDGPAVTLSLVLVESATGLEDRLLGTTSSGDETDHSTAIRSDDLLLTRGELKDGAVDIRVVTNDGGVLSGSTSEGASVSSALLDVANDGTFGQQTDGQDVSDGKLGTTTGIDELASEHTLGGNESLSVLSGSGDAVEDNLSKGSSTSRVVNDGLHQSLDISVALGVVQHAVLSSSNTVVGVRLEDTSRSLTLSTNNTTHLKLYKQQGFTKQNS